MAHACPSIIENGNGRLIAERQASGSDVDLVLWKMVVGKTVYYRLDRVSSYNSLYVNSTSRCLCLADIAALDTHLLCITIRSFSEGVLIDTD